MQREEVATTIEKFKPAIYRASWTLVRRNGLPAQEIEDVAADLVCELIRWLPTFDSKRASLSGYILLILRTASQKLQRKIYKNWAPQKPDLVEPKYYDREMLGADLRMDVEEILKKCPKRARNLARKIVEGSRKYPAGYELGLSRCQVTRVLENRLRPALRPLYLEEAKS